MFDKPAFAGHEICTDDAWIDAFHVHPTATGHARGYLPLVAAATAAARPDGRREGLPASSGTVRRTTSGG